MTSKVVFLMVVALLSLSVLAAPAPWYKWRSKVDGETFCAQTSPGEGWEKLAGPYKDARCEKYSRRSRLTGSGASR